MANIVNVKFDKNHNGILKTENSETNLSYRGEGFSPYELLLGGYASCLHATLLGILKKRRIEVTNITYNVEAFKREEVPTIINKLITNVLVEGANPKKHEQIIKSLHQAEVYCSISDTIKRLDAEMILNIEFI